MINKVCEYCDSPYISLHPNSRYCPGKLCASKMNAIKKRIRQKAFHNTLEPRQCKRCGKQFKFHGMKQMCQECVEFLKEKPHHYRKELIMEKSNICEKCKVNEKHSKNPNAKYCTECVIKIKAEKIERMNERRKKDYKVNVVENKKKKKDVINPFFLKRNLSDKS